MSVDPGVSDSLHSERAKKEIDGDRSPWTSLATATQLLMPSFPSGLNF